MHERSTGDCVCTVHQYNSGTLMYRRIICMHVTMMPGRLYLISVLALYYSKPQRKRNDNQILVVVRLIKGEIWPRWGTGELPVQMRAVRARAVMLCEQLKQLACVWQRSCTPL